jgi:hypothetical protein
MAVFEHVQPLQFSLRQLLFAVTTIALGLGALRTPLPQILSVMIAVSAPLVWSGVAVLILGSWTFHSQASPCRTVGALVISAGVAIAGMGAIIGFFALFVLSMLLVSSLGDWILRPTHYVI